MTDISIGADTFRVEVEGDATKPVLMLSHALGTDLGLWDAQMPALLKAFRVVRYDARGHGGSTASDGPFSIARLGRDVLAILDALEIEAVHFLGVSMGGAVGQWLLVHAPHRVERVVLANTTAKFGTSATWNERIVSVLDNGMAAIVDGTMERWFSPAFAERAPEKTAPIGATLETGSPEGYAACCAALRDFDLREALRGVTAPVLVVSGRDDASVSEEAARHLVDTIAGAKHAVLDARHLSNVEADAAFTKAVVGFLTAKIAVKIPPAVAVPRPAKNASRRVGMRRSTAARLPVGAMAKPQVKQSAAKPTRAVAESKVESRPEKAKPAKNKTARGGAPHTTTIAAKGTIAAKRMAKTAALEGKPAKAKIGKSKLDRAKLGAAVSTKLAPRSAPKTTSSAKTTRVAAPMKSVKRPSAKSLKAMAAASTARAAKTPVAKKPAGADLSAKAVPRRKKTAAPIAKGKVAPPDSKAKSGRALVVKTDLARKPPAKKAGSQATSAPMRVAKAKPAPTAKTKPRRRAS